MKKIKLRNYKKIINSIRFSLELEVEFPKNIDVDLLRTRYRKLLGSWTVVTEGSLENGIEFHPKDTNHLHFNKESFAEISEVLYVIRKHKGRVDSKKCGLHIHIDAKKFTNIEIIKIIKEMIARQKFIIQDFKVRKDRLDKYCQLIKKSDIKKLNEETLHNFRKQDTDYSIVPLLCSKYYLLNISALKEHGTLEFRLFNGVKYVREIRKIITYLFTFLITALERE